jgi:7-cyano-7-deazaguanine synthase
MLQSKSILSLSGGVDSTTVLARMMDENRKVECFGFDYGSKHSTYELPAAKRIAGYYGVPFSIVDLTEISRHLSSNLLKSGGPIPEGHYEAENMKLTVVPCRNIIFLSILAGIAESKEADIIAIGIHQGDHAIYPDCRLEFFQQMDGAIRLGTDGKVGLYAPFLSTDKTGIVKWGLQHGVPYRLTRTCYKDQPEPCGKCGSCVERLEAFEKNGAKDRTN